MLKAIVIHRLWLFQRAISPKGGTPPLCVSWDSNGNIQCNHRQHTMISLFAYDDFAISIRCFCPRHCMPLGWIPIPLHNTLFIIGYDCTPLHHSCGKTSQAEFTPSVCSSGDAPGFHSAALTYRRAYKSLWSRLIRARASSGWRGGWPPSPANAWQTSGGRCVG